MNRKDGNMKRAVFVLVSFLLLSALSYNRANALTVNYVDQHIMGYALIPPNGQIPNQYQDYDFSNTSTTGVFEQYGSAQVDLTSYGYSNYLSSESYIKSNIISSGNNLYFTAFGNAATSTNSFIGMAFAESYFTINFTVTETSPMTFISTGENRSLDFYWIDGTYMSFIGNTNSSGNTSYNFSRELDPGTYTVITFADALNGSSSLFNLSLSIGTAPASVPEPSTLFLLGSGLVGLVGYRRSRSGK